MSSAWPCSCPTCAVPRATAPASWTWTTAPGNARTRSRTWGRSSTRWRPTRHWTRPGSRSTASATAATCATPRRCITATACARPAAPSPFPTSSPSWRTPRRTGATCGAWSTATSAIRPSVPGWRRYRRCAMSGRSGFR
ncbi:hypothetical protein SDC9_211894 [bioreactor metagenome]|uniref:Uncharacterized protein n=1 Tax=bioreactor metagenome TaxID=1076179 RepID=A0A645JYE7_9ZZZZ